MGVRVLAPNTYLTADDFCGIDRITYNAYTLSSGVTYCGRQFMNVDERYTRHKPMSYINCPKCRASLPYLNALIEEETNGK